VFLADSGLASRLLYAGAMNLHHIFLASTTLALLPSCTAPLAPLAPPLADPASHGTPGLTATWKTAPDVSSSNLVATSAGEAGAVAYLEGYSGGDQGDVRSRVLLQRLDASGLVRGAPVELADMEAPAPEHLTLATDGSRYLACWDQAAQISCATVPLGEGSASSAFTVVAGASPALTHGPGGFALAYRLPGHVAAVHLASDGTVAGKPTMIAMNDAATKVVVFASTRLGFALVGGSHFGDGTTVHVHQLDSAFAPVGDPVDLGVTFWRHAALTTTDTTVAVSLAKPYAAQLFLLEGGHVGHTHELGGGGKQGLNTALAADGAAIGMLSADDENGIRYRVIDGDAVKTPADVEEGAVGRFNDGYFAALRLHGDMFVAAALGNPGGEIIVARVQRP
jgi:hypothetical protein